MKRLAILAFLVFVALGARVDAGDLPEAASLVGRHATDNFTHFVRADQALPEAASLVGRHATDNFTHFVRADQALPEAASLVGRQHEEHQTHGVRAQ